MTRINVVPPEELSGPHLVAEYRELPRIFGLVRARIKKGQTPKDVNIPKNYKLGKDHLKFFFNKLHYLENRQRRLIREMENRGYKPTFTTVDISDIGPEWKNSYIPTDEALQINRERIKERSRT